MLIEEQTFDALDIQKSPLEKGHYEYCIFKDCQLSSNDLRDFVFVECEFVDCDLSNANITGAAFREVRFLHCKMLGMTFDYCHTFGFEVCFESCILDHSSFYQMNLTNSSFHNSSLQEVDFTEANLSKGKMIGCQLSLAVFDRTNLEKADMTGAEHYDINPENNKIKGLKVSADSIRGFLSLYGLKIID